MSSNVAESSPIRKLAIVCKLFRILACLLALISCIASLPVHPDDETVAEPDSLLRGNFA
jgi:hypothetical protein